MDTELTEEDMEGTQVDLKLSHKRIKEKRVEKTRDSQNKWPSESLGRSDYTAEMI
jgi:hypothetical protein